MKREEDVLLDFELHQLIEQLTSEDSDVSLSESGASENEDPENNPEGLKSII